MAISDDDLERLGRCVELARMALDGGDEPFGSILVDADGPTLFEDRNRVKDGDQPPAIPSSRSPSGRWPT